jgi:hypothetical protein
VTDDKEYQFHKETDDKEYQFHKEIEAERDATRIALHEAEKLKALLDEERGRSDALRRELSKRSVVDAQAEKIRLEIERDQHQAVTDLFRDVCSGCGGRFPKEALQFMGVRPDKQRVEIKLCVSCRNTSGIGSKEEKK